jgi:phosphopantothenoylcysteine decarboxylase
MDQTMLNTGQQRMLYLVVCGAPPASEVGQFIPLAQEANWDVGVIATPSALKFLNTLDVEAQTGHPVRAEYRMPGESAPFPDADAIVVAPATFNTLNKWALGIADTLAVGTLCEYLGRGVPIVVAPCLKQDLARHPAFPKSKRILAKWGVRILHEPNKYKSPQIAPWEDILQQITLPSDQVVSSKGMTNREVF